MKKSFMFVAVAAAGMLASCSSESLTAGSDPQIEPTQEELVPIEISVATPMARSGMTRGTGTVGGVEDGHDNAVNNDGSAGGAKNIWAGQKINVYMFKKGSLKIAKFKDTDPTGIFDNAEMDTPAASEDTNEGRAHYVDPAASGRYLEKYYPLEGVYDFWGYRIDDATVNSAPAENAGGDLFFANITVDGTQDVLGAKTVPADWGDLDDPHKAPFAGSEEYNTYIASSGKLYSASSARKLIQPRLEFNHLMTRLTFEAYPGNANAKTVYVTGIRVRAINDTLTTEYQTPVGTLDIAGTADGFKQKITWEANTSAPAPFELMKRVKSQDVYSVIAANSWYSLNSANTDVSKFITAEAYTALPATGTAGDGNDKDEYTAIAENSWYALTAAPTNNNSFISATAFAALPATSTAAVNQPLVDLIDTHNANLATNGAISMNLSATDGTVKAPIGDAIIAPDAQAYEIEIDLAQKVAKYEDSDVAVPGDWSDYTFNSIKTIVRARPSANSPAPRFEIGKSYDFIFKVYGLEKIEVNAVLEPWIFGEAIGVVTE